MYFRIPITFKTTANFDVQWYSGDQLLVTNEKYILVNNKESTVLVIKNIDADDENEYRCIISNDKNTYSFKTFLHITSIEKII